MKAPLIFLFLCFLNACTSPPQAPQADYKILLSSHDPLTDAQLAQAVKMLADTRTNPDVRGYLYERLATEEYARFEEPLKAKTKELNEAMPIVRGVLPEFTLDNIKKGAPDIALTALQAFHEPSDYLPSFQTQIHPSELQYISYMLDFMELPIPYPRKINGLKNIQRVMEKPKSHNELNDPEMKEIRKRLYDLALSEKSPDNVRRGLAEWLREMR